MAKIKVLEIKDACPFGSTRNGDAAAMQALPKQEEIEQEEIELDSLRPLCL